MKMQSEMSPKAQEACARPSPGFQMNDDSLFPQIISVMSRFIESSFEIIHVFTAFSDKDESLKKFKNDPCPYYILQMLTMIVIINEMNDFFYSIKEYQKQNNKHSNCNFYLTSKYFIPPSLVIFCSVQKHLHK